MPQIRVLIGLIAVAIAAVLASADSLQLASQLQQDPWGVQSAAQRFSSAVTRLPPLDEVGYISDLAIDGKDGTPAFLAAQYALAPRLVTPVGRTALADLAAPRYAVGNFARPADFTAAGAKAGYALEADLGNGVVLYKKVLDTKAK
jgi:hypothetical protein